MKQLSFGRQQLNTVRAWAARGTGLAVILSASTSGVHAHPGHALTEQGVAHVVTSPYHLAFLAITGLLLVGASRLAGHRVARRALQAGGAVALVAAAILWGSGM